MDQIEKVMNLFLMWKSVICAISHFIVTKITPWHKWHRDTNDSVTQMKPRHKWHTGTPSPPPTLSPLATPRGPAQWTNTWLDPQISKFNGQEWTGTDVEWGMVWNALEIKSGESSGKAPGRKEERKKHDKKIPPLIPSTNSLYSLPPLTPSTNSLH